MGTQSATQMPNLGHLILLIRFQIKPALFRRRCLASLMLF